MTGTRGPGPAADPPPLKSFGLVLHRDGHWTHEGQTVTHGRLRAAFDRSVRFLPREGVYVVQLGRFRGQIDVEETGFFVRSFDAATGEVALSDGSREPIDVRSLRTASADGALLCAVKRDAVAGGLPARFVQAAQAQLLDAVEEGPRGPSLRLEKRLAPLPPL